ncbi:SusD/RagB family nutrient-binding outer membrane lipoprotein [Hymenobacter sp. BT770]|uniref:SusD/RagB family nutrient-binding outer membrane lipoprotein n=1 Tax=Hymenobacter sp. BT770 TaxID=2886942 RepID=UPI001D0FF0EB|nr:SusD/RagB family nutrient-binding outer membrane lipoprotein [Hymenobacter sp. BT770]MCC3152620.1 SusD/RagB family nutrient-binding outer membrane lipoprotein [Hymenobacter sp. BT770]MDO3414693.1 SusD/RagB family nutrient-binding outer membrane lipoprotein [Hymenobacter sp. BT770]
MKFRTISTALALTGLLMGTPGCKDFYDVNVDPIHPSKAELQQLLPVTQTATSTYLGFNIAGLGQPTSALMQQLSNGRSIGNFQQTGDSFSGPWNGLYSDMLANNELLITQGTSEQRWGYVGIAQLQKAYVFSQLVDMFGDVPYSEALKGAQNTSPRFDKDADIYNGNPGLGIQGLFALIDEGLGNLAKPGAGVTGTSDLIYGGDLTKWARFGRTLKLKLLVQIRKTRSDAAFQQQVAALLTGTDGLLEATDDFEFKYGSSESPANRNVGYLADYVNAGRENNIGRFLYLLMKYGDGTNPSPTSAVRPIPNPALGYADPRVPYYFFNQLATRSSPDRTTYDYQDPNDGRFVTTRPGSTGPANASALSSSTRTLPGLYPVGGRYDDGRGGNANTTFGRGVVAQRLLPYFSRKFLEAEAQLVILNNRAAARTALQAALQASFDKVNAIALAEGTSPSPTSTSGAPYPTAIPSGSRALGPIPAAEITTYINGALARFDGTATGPAKTPLQVIMEEKYVASFGMGPDIYTDWRRTGYPILTVPDNNNIGGNVGLVEDNDPITTGAGLFPRRLYYSQQDITANANPSAPKAQVDPASPTYRIFWDR